MDKIEKLVNAVVTAEGKVVALQKYIKETKAKIKELEESQLLNDVHELEASGVAIKDIISAIKSNDESALMNYLIKSNTGMKGGDVLDEKNGTR